MSAHIVELAVPPVVVRLTVKAPPERAFAAFVEEIHRWWPLATHRIDARSTTCLIEPRLGGRLLERSPDGTEQVWGHVTAYAPPRRLAFTWQVMCAPDEAQDVEVRFTATAGGTEIRLTHVGWERLGERAAAKRAMYDKGWAQVLGVGYAAHVDRIGMKGSAAAS
jgi:uncharacterized protein YndB with AHSA1/START domain